MSNEQYPVGLGCDHGGYELKKHIMKYLTDHNIPFKDFGSGSNETVDYMDIAVTVSEAVASGECEKAILFCGTGIGMSIAANKIKGIRAACCSDCFSAKLTRMHNDANVLCLGGRVVGPGLGLMMVDLFLNTEFEGGRHQRRVEKVMALEQEIRKP